MHPEIVKQALRRMNTHTTGPFLFCFVSNLGAEVRFFSYDARAYMSMCSQTDCGTIQCNPSCHPSPLAPHQNANTSATPTSRDFFSLNLSVSCLTLFKYEACSILCGCDGQINFPSSHAGFCYHTRA